MWWLITLLHLVAARNVFVSSPFDNFRIECPKRTAAVELTIRMVESVGAKRQDIVFDMGCEKVDELFPWVNIPTGIIEIEREDCYYSGMFDPIIDETTEFSCRRREYMAGITRLTDTRVQIMCCRLRSREETNCSETFFNKPIGPTKSTILEYDNQLINAIRLDGDRYVVRFCDLAPRDIGSIYDDVKTTTTTPIPVTYPFTPNAKSYSKYRKVEKLQQRMLTRGGNSAPSSPISPIYTPARAFVPAQFPTLVPYTTPAANVGRISMGKMFDNGKDLEKMLIEADHAADITSPAVATTYPELYSTNGASRALSSGPNRGTPPYLGSGRSNEFYDDGEDEVELDMSTIAASSMDPNPRTILKDSSRILQVALSTPIISQQEEDPQTSIKDGNSVEALGSEEYEDEELTSEPVNTAPTVQPPTSEGLGNSTIETSGATTINKLGRELTTASEDEREETTTRNQPPVKAVKDTTMITDLSRLTFPNEEFPKSNEKKLVTSTRVKITKTDLPLKTGMSVDDFLFLHPVNSDGHRRSPLRTYRPHVEISSSQEDDETGQIQSSWETTSVETPRPRKTIKLRKKISRAHRISHPEIKEQNTHDSRSSFSILSDNVVTVSSTDSAEIREVHAGHTTTSSSRRDLPAARKVAESMTHKVDNAHSVDEETISSPFEDENLTENLNGIHEIFPNRMNISFQADEDIEDVILKLTSSNTNIRRAPVRESHPPDQYDKHDLETGDPDKDVKEDVALYKDGSKTHVPVGQQPIAIPELAIFEKRHKGETIFEEIAKEHFDEESTGEEKDDDDVEQLKQVTDNLVLVSSKSFVGESSTQKATMAVSANTPDAQSSSDELEEETSEVRTDALAPTTPLRSTTVYNTATFYHTPVPRKKKEKILTFCTKDVAVRDVRNMVIACGGEEDVWKPNRCPVGSDCLLSQDSTYRLCCPVFRGV